jgi:3-dehydroquinate synthase
VFIDPSLLGSLPDRQRMSGWAEIVKHGVIADADHFRWLEREAGRLDRLPAAAWEEVLAASLRIKARVVAADERESDLRMVLNYGHTVGHAIESLTGYGSYSHGEAVAIGMSAEGRIARKLGFLREEDRLRQDRLLRRIGFDLRFPDLRISPMLRAMARDKKARSGRLTFALPRRIGAMHRHAGRYGIAVDPAVAAEALREARS